jgi:hypothetical protein
MPDGTDLRASLGSTDTPGTYRVSVEVGVATPGNLRVRIAHGERSFDIVPQRRQRWRQHENGKADFRLKVTRDGAGRLRQPDSPRLALGAWPVAKRAEIAVEQPDE